MTILSDSILHKFLEPLIGGWQRSLDQLDKGMWRLLLIGFFLSSCASRSGYRQGLEASIEKLGANVSLAHLELDDQGELLSRNQLKAVTEQIQKESKEDPILLVVFIHGWNRNASHHERTGGKDLAHFRTWLSELSERDSEYKTMGVMVSWRGRSLSPFPIGVDFFHRYAAARRMGGVIGAEVLHEIGATARASNQRSRIMMMGHSMGGAILESCFSEAIASKVAVSHAQRRPLLRKDFPADLLITINSAESAIHARQLISTFKRRGIRDVEGGPLIVSVTSQDDLATAFAYPIGNALGRYVPPFNWFNTSVSGVYRKKSQLDQLQGTQAQAHRTTVGHFTPLFSHRYREGPRETRTLKEILEDNKAAQGPGGVVVAGETRTFYFERPQEPFYNDSPYWIMPVPGAIMKDHRDIWNHSFLGMVSALMSIVESP